jgi:prepilin-type N-terminal cleavage/methylation domain-containing protein
MQKNKKGFTLIELLIVIGILAVLATITVLVLNPAQLFAQARDSQRLSDLASIRSAIIFVQSTVSPAPTLGTTAYSTGTPTNCSVAPFNIYSADCAPNVIRSTGGAGWVGFDFSGVSPAPLAQLPIDPANGANFYYTYKGSSTGFKLGAIMESTKYGSTTDVDGTDGGPAAGFYEVGTRVTDAF